MRIYDWKGKFVSCDCGIVASLMIRWKEMLTVREGMPFKQPRVNMMALETYRADPSDCNMNVIGQ